VDAVTLIMAGISSAAFGLCYWSVDVLGQRSAFKPLEIFGLNAIAGYVISRLVSPPLKAHVFGRTLYDGLHGLLRNPANASLGFALLNMAVVFGVVAVMYRQKLFVKL
jgi:predicted acyltransferase